MALLLLLVQLLTTLMMTGILWFIQIVHYPLMGKVGEASFRKYEELHVTFTGYLLAPIMLIEAATATLLVFFPLNDHFYVLFFNVVLLMLIWVSTFAVQVPLHNRLMQGFESKAWQKLCSSNMHRTALWSIRALLLCYILFAEMQ